MLPETDDMNEESPRPSRSGSGELDPDRFAVLRQGATEPPWSWDLNWVHENGVFRCGACGAALFRPGQVRLRLGLAELLRPAAEEAVETEVDASQGIAGSRSAAPACDSHLGHVFPDGPSRPASATASTRWRSTSSLPSRNSLKYPSLVC